MSEPMCPTLDNWDRAYMAMERDNLAMVEDIRARLARGEKGKQIQNETGIPQQLVSIVRQTGDPNSDTSRRIAAWRVWKAWRVETKKAEAARKMIELNAKKKARELRVQLWDGTGSYDEFLKRLKGEPVKGKRVPILDYSEEDEVNAQRTEGRTAPKRYRKALRELLPLKERAFILAKLARSEDEGVALRAMQIIHRMEGVERKPQEATKGEPAQGPMFSLTSGVSVSVAPVGDGSEPIKH